MPGSDAERRISSRGGMSRAGPGNDGGCKARITCGGCVKSNSCPARLYRATTDAEEEQAVEARVAEKEGLVFANG